MLEFIPGGSIASMLTQFGAFSESLIKKFVCHILLGLDYLHNKGIIHRYVCPSAHALYFAGFKYIVCYLVFAEI